ncbi:disulfide bond formation protein DsbB [Paenibacillus taihuensis]|uniref:Disulfide bond formation protein DsbB n=1 Tax=Paenibacillus taihuensis TaxID=1156355 RepID=A0A3D9RQY9_9BACL|nr:disulfide oxidoreductase [Paenibacillus taihuensis]REE80131.1 disulfide bond formation protein DsbB [Paenibacillus taihuensis]
MTTKSPLLAFFSRYALYLAWVVSIVAVGGSLYLSEIMKFVPCNLCWYQRIFMYPIIILLGIASYGNDRKIMKYVLPLSIIGGSISLYHYLEQQIPALAKMLPCTVGVPCSEDYLDWFGGYVTIPFLALIAFVLITALLINGIKHEDASVEDDEEAAEFESAVN